ncbi:26427_t:CDS:2, partial [Racocetra persica]
LDKEDLTKYFKKCLQDNLVKLINESEKPTYRFVRRIVLKIDEQAEREGKSYSNLQEAKNELQAIFDKTLPYQQEISFIMSRGRTAEDMLKGLEKHELEKGKEALEEMEKIVYLSKMEKHLLNEIIKKLGIINLESEIQDLKNQTFTSPQQQAENQAKIAKKQKELEEFKKNAEKKQGFVKQEISTIKNQIHQSLQKNNLKTSDLPPQYQN